MLGNTCPIERLNESNYEIWKLQMKSVLVINDLWSCVDGTDPKPEKECDKWSRKDGKALAMINLSVSPSQLNLIAKAETSKEAWDLLKKTYASTGPVRKFIIYRQLLRMQKEPHVSISQYINEFSNKVELLERVGIKMQDELLTVMLLSSLPAEFDNFVIAIETRDEVPPFSEVKIKLLEEEARQIEKNNAEEPNPNSALVAKGKWRKKIVKDNRRDPDSEKKVPKRKGNCFKCGKIGHFANECRSSPRSNRSRSKAETLLSVAYNCRTSKEQWCLDSGATRHICNNKRKFTSLDGKKSDIYTISNECVRARGTGEVTLRMNGRNVTLKDTLYMPSSRSNLLSVPRVTKRGYTVVFKSDRAEIIRKDGSTLATAKREGGLYVIEEPERMFYTRDRDNTKRWHQRYGHLNLSDLKKLESQRMVEGMKLMGKNDTLNCEICARGKIHQLPFKKSTSRSENALDLVHSDICGPMKVRSAGGARFFVTFIDDYSRYTEVYMLKNKSDVLEKFKVFKARVENFTGRKIKCIRTDNAREYLSKEFKNILEECGISRQLSAEYTPQQNGIAERANRTLIEMARCLMLQGNLPQSLWAEAVNTANYLRNRCPTRALNDRTPFEAWSGKKPYVGFLRIIGSKAVVLNKGQKRGKFEAKGETYVLVGYSQESKAYRLWKRGTNTIIKSRDVKFFEEVTDEDGGKFHPFELYEDTHRDTGEDEDATSATDEEPISDEEADPQRNQRIRPSSSGSAHRTRRGPGRPKKLRTGKPGRPKKVYHETEYRQIDYAFITEIPVDRALSSPESEEWQEAIANEISSILQKKTWKLIDKPVGCKTIGCRMILTNKYNADGMIQKRKARLVAKGYSQRPGIHFKETFAPVARINSIRLLLAIAAKLDMHVHQLDISNAYLNGYLKEEIYMEIPKNYENILRRIVKDEKFESEVRANASQQLQQIKHGNKVCKLKRSLYGLKQAGHVWNLELDKQLKRLGMRPTYSDTCIYLNAERGGGLLIAAVYVDYILLFSKNSKTIRTFIGRLAEVFKLRNLGEAKHCLGIEIHRGQGNLKINQPSYIQAVLERFGMSDCKPVTSPVDVSIRLEKEKKTSNNLPFRELIGALMWLSVATRPDIAYAVNSLSQFNNCFGRTHWTAAKRILRYLKGTKDVGITYEKSTCGIIGYSDADWGACPIDRRSYTGVVFVLSRGAISWESKKQRTVALSSTEAEYMALTESVKEAIYLKKFVAELGFPELGDIMIFCDNMGALKLSQNDMFHSRTKHIDIRHHFVREAVKNGKVTVKHIGTEEMAADMLTKGLASPKIIKNSKSVGLS
ncbi:UNVERIFIED_CONTAM: hypothetical protein PYX00_004278 [Menopon gallinae]|uniref:Retrovirus-related Pol polyprotein from transposon TNT 1-94 n=1 Tax=Menopon gallinae TaxID=328185 RepID=A0AAW2I4L1_9NEOP